MSGEFKDIELIKRRKILELMKQQIRKQIREAMKKDKREDIYEKIKPLMTEKGYDYLIRLRESKKNVADKIIQYIAYGLMYGLIPIPIDEITVEYLERRIEGRTGKILVERRGELKSLEDIFKGEG